MLISQHISVTSPEMSKPNKIPEIIDKCIHCSKKVNVPTESIMVALSQPYSVIYEFRCPSCSQFTKVDGNTCVLKTKVIEDTKK